MHEPPRVLVLEVLEIHPELSVLLETHETTQLIDEPRLSVTRQPHDLVFVVRSEPEVQGDPRIEHAERVRKIDALGHRNIRALSKTPRRAGKISKTID